MQILWLQWLDFCHDLQQHEKHWASGVRRKPWLTEVFCLAGNVPGTGKRVFNNSPISLAMLYVPEESVETYWQTSPWSGFGTIAALPTEVVTFAKDQMATTILPTAPDASKGFISRAGRSC